MAFHLKYSAQTRPESQGLAFETVKLEALVLPQVILRSASSGHPEAQSRSTDRQLQRLEGLRLRRNEIERLLRLSQDGQETEDLLNEQRQLEVEKTNLIAGRVTLHQVNVVQALKRL